MTRIVLLATSLITMMACYCPAESLQFEFIFNPDNLTFTPVGMYERVDLKDATLPSDDPKGQPWLPAKFIQVLLPPDAMTATCDAQVDGELIYTNILVLPAQPPIPTGQPAPVFSDPDPAVYTSTHLIPLSSAETGNVHRMRDQSFLSVRLNPVRYVPARRELHLANKIVLTISFRSSPANLAANMFVAPASAIFDNMISNLVINPEQLKPLSEQLAKTALPNAATDYLIITSAALSNSFQRLADHRRNLNGLTTKVITVEYIGANYSGIRPDGGTDLQTQIRNCIASFVSSQGTVYVVLGGDINIIPDRDCYVACSGYTESAMPTDLYYGGLNGTWDENANGVYGEANYSGSLDEGDLAYDVIVGRIPVRTTAQADAYINKLIQYETGTMPSGFSRKLLLGGYQLWNSYTDSSRPTDSIGDGYSEFQQHTPVSDAEIWCRRCWRDKIHAFDANAIPLWVLDTVSSWDTTTPGDFTQSSANMVTVLNRGWNQFSFNTHGNTTIWGLESGYFSTTSANLLTNTVTFVYTMACLSGAFDTAEPSLSEAFLRNGGGGALVYLGCSRYGWGSPGSYRGGPSMDYENAYYDQLYNRRRTYAGQAFAEHKLSQISASAYDGAARWIQFGMNLQGDPLVPLFKPDISLGTNRFWFTAVALTNNVFLRWPNPQSCGITNRTVQVRYDTGHYPSNLTDGAEAYTGTNQVYEHTGLTPLQPYYYTIWVSQDGVNFVDPPP
jgi:hypothetical protein